MEIGGLLSHDSRPTVAFALPVWSSRMRYRIQLNAITDLPSGLDTFDLGGSVRSDVDTGSNVITWVMAA